MSRAQPRRHTAVLTTSYPVDNADASGHFVACEVQRLVRAGERVSVLCAGLAPSTPQDSVEYTSLGGGETFAWPGVLSRILQAPWRVADVLRFLQRARSVLRSGRYDQLVAHWLLPCGWPLAGAFQGPLEVVIHGTDARLFQALPRPLQRHILNQLDARKATLRLVASSLLACFSAHAEHPALQRARVEPCCLNLARVPARDAARQALGLEASQFVAVVVGRLIAQKRIHLALQLDAPQLGVPQQHGASPLGALPTERRFQQTLRVVIGDGPERPTLEHAFPEVRFVGKRSRSETLLWIRAADVLVCASAAEGAPSCIREARALGTRVLSAPVGDVPRWAEQDPGIELVQTWATCDYIRPAI